MRCTQPALQRACTTAYPWLQTLKAAQLQRIAQTTGIQSSGPKASLIHRLDSELAQCEYRPDDPDPKGSKSTTLSILSIDMGIRNLAFAHLLVPRSERTLPGNETVARRRPLVTPTLNAWRRLAISDLAPAATATTTTAGIHPGDKSRPGNCPPSMLRCSSTDSRLKSKENFSPALYASLAYDLLTSLLDTYRPTHVLIERQRFRSGGGSAVQEWTLRVGVFEGMLYAVLYALRRERSVSGIAEGRGPPALSPVVVGVEPQRVARYWGDSLEGERDGKGGRRTTSAREGKKIKIDLVGRWLDSVSGGSMDSATEISDTIPPKVLVGQDPELRRWVDGYLERWRGEGKRTRRKGTAQSTSHPDSGPEIGKLDDLADCLLQGVTWLEWQVMRDRISREGFDAIHG